MPVRARIATGLRAGRTGDRILAGARDFSTTVQTDAGYWGSLPGVKRPGREVDSSSCGTEIKNECSCTSFPSIRLIWP
jgi:hypothetical protein